MQNNVNNNTCDNFILTNNLLNEINEINYSSKNVSNIINNLRQELNFFYNTILPFKNNNKNIQLDIPDSEDFCSIFTKLHKWSKYMNSIENEINTILKKNCNHEFIEDYIENGTESNMSNIKYCIHCKINSD